MRSYNETITWIQFRTVSRNFPPAFWLLIGRIHAGLDLLNGIPLPVAETRAMERELVLLGTQARFSLDGINVPAAALIAEMKAKNGVSAASSNGEVSAYLRSLSEAASSTSVAFGPDAIRAIHRTMTEHTGEEDRPGQWRMLPTGGRPWEGVPEDVVGLFTEEFCEWLKSDELAAPSRSETVGYALLRMLLTELYLAWIRPFPTAHYRVAAGVSARLLADAGMGPNAVHFLSIALHRSSREFSRQVQQASEGTADPVPFLLFALRGMAEVLQEFHDRIREHQKRGQWRAQLLELFQEGNDEPTRRQRQILLDMADSPEPVPLNRLSSLSTTLARLYAGVSEKTMRRDVDALLQAGVLQRGPEGLRVDLSNILAFRALSA